MHKVNLYTKKGELVVTVITPVFNPMPDCIVWGSRFFFKNLEGFEKKDAKGYYEGFAVAAISMTPDTPVKEREEFGDDGLLFGLPKDLDEAIEDYLTFYSKSEDFNKINRLKESEFLSVAHHGSGQFIRNSWYLWWHEGHQYKEWPKTKPNLVQWFNNLGIFHADDMSGIIITSAYRKHNKMILELEKQVTHYKNYWKTQGFEDGIYKPK